MPDSRPHLAPLRILLLAAFALVAQAQAQDQAAQRPNIVLILSDDQNATDLGCAGHPWLQTPNLDLLAAEGVRFTRAFVTTALCSPSRATFLTGQYARAHGILSNTQVLGAELPSFASELRGAGYLTAYVGKWHMGTGGGPRPGFDYSATYAGQGRVRNLPFLVGREKTEKVATKGWVDDVATDYAIQFLRDSRRRPLLLCLGFKSPHTPRVPDERHASLYKDEPLPEAQAAKRFPPYPTRPEFERLVKAANSDDASFVTPDDWLEHWEGPRIPETELVRGSGQGEDLRNYYRLITGLDENVGRLLATLDELNLTRNTIVIFASDNGVMNGRLGTFGKRSAYDEAITVPLIVRYPEGMGVDQAGSVQDALVLNLDIAPTLLDLAGVEIPASMRGHSLRPLLQAANADWRKEFLIEYLPSRAGPSPEILALRTDRWKLVTYPGHAAWTELFDLEADPLEEHDLGSEAGHSETITRLTADLAAAHQAAGPRLARPAAKARGK
ncbi:MAG: N-acetylglucosamine-6-sulfatase [Planctomycetota bacterium]|jgi:N-acetylglucosamine-6-sulfatase